MEDNSRELAAFFTKNLLRGLFSFALFLIAFIFLRDWILSHYNEWLLPIAEQPFLLYLFFFANELIFGLIPPEAFMLLFIPFGTSFFIKQILWMTLLSYCGGFLAFLLGRFSQRFPKFNLYQRIPKLANWHSMYHKYGGWLIFIAAVTPVPFALVSMLFGSLKYPFGKYALYASLRFIRFVLYGYIFWLANSI